MADVSLDISAVDRGARRLVKDLVTALLGLKRGTLDLNKAQQSATGSRAQANALRDQLQIAQAVIRDRQRQLDQLRQISAEEIRLAKETSKKKIDEARRETSERNRLAAESRDAQRQRVADARSAVRQEIDAQKQLIASVKDEVAARHASLRATTEVRGQELRDAVDSARQKVRALVDERDRRRAIVSGQIEDQKKLRNELRAERKITVDPAGREDLAKQIAQRQSRITALRQERREINESYAEQLNARRKALADRKNEATEESRIARERLNTSRTIGRQEIADAKTRAGQAVSSRRDVLSAAQQELSSRRNNLTTIRQQGREEVAAARASGTAAVAAARIKTQADIRSAATGLRTSKNRVARLREEAREAEQSARRQERALGRFTAALRRQGTAIPGLNAGLNRLRGTVLQLISAYAGFRVINGFIARGIAFNQMIESSKLGIAALITASSDLVDVNGQLLTGTTALSAAQGLAQDQLDKLRIAGIQTSATTEELVLTFQEATAAGLAVGLTLDQIRKFSVSVAQAATAINLPMNQLQQETRSILQGTIDRNSRIAKSLNLTNAEVNLAKQQGRLMDLLNEKFAAFNIAGVESVKTFSALKSNIQDAFSVFAGIAVKPLFEDLRNAGQEALARVFDFNTAEIRENFQGLIEGLQALFGQIGQVFSGAIRDAVDRAEELSKWFKNNREEVRKTAAAVATMVEDFGKMIAAIATGIAEMVSFGGEVNTVTGLARTLSAVFETIAENVKLIIALLTGRALLSAISKIVVGIAALRGAAIGAAAGSVVPGVGTVLGAVIGLVAGYKLLQGTEEKLRRETARLGNTFADQHLRGVELIGTIVNIEAALNKSAKGSEEAAELTERLAKAEADLIELGPEYANIINNSTLSLEQQRKKLVELAKAQETFTAFRLQQAQNEGRLLREERAALTKKGPATIEREIGPGEFIQERDVAGHKRRLGAIDEALEINRLQVAATTDEYNTFADALHRATTPPATIRPRKAEEEGAGGEPQFVRQARAELERIKAEIEAQQAVARASFETGAINNQQLIQFIAATEIAAITAEQKLIDVLQEKALQDLRKARKEKKPEGVQASLDQFKALESQRAGLVAKRTEIEARAAKEGIELEQDRADSVLEIEQRRLQATGQLHEAALLEIKRKTDKSLREAIQEFGGAELRLAASKIAPGDVDGLRKLLVDMRDQLPPVVVDLAFVIDQEAIREQVQAVEEQIKRAEEQRNRESEAIRARFQALGKLSNQERQQQLTELSDANQRAVDSTAALRAQLIQMKTEAASPELVTHIDILIARLDAMKAKAEEVNVEMRALREGAREAIESGLSEFFQSIGDGSKTAGGHFKAMVKGIIDDMRRLVSEMIARNIAGLIFGTAARAATGTIGGGQSVGNTTPSHGLAKGGLARQKRAAGGPARPPHGVLHGGVPGKDSIPIDAMPDEYFVRREATKKYGADVLDLFNEMRVPVTWARELFSLMRTNFVPRPLKPRLRFAEGGSVGRMAGSTARPVMRQEVMHMIGLDRNGALTFLNGSEGRQIVLGHVATAPRFLNRRLNGNSKGQ